jgi:hypothetical protein
MTKYTPVFRAFFFDIVAGFPKKENTSAEENNGFAPKL